MGSSQTKAERHYRRVINVEIRSYLRWLRNLERRGGLYACVEIPHPCIRAEVEQGLNAHGYFVYVVDAPVPPPGKAALEIAPEACGKVWKVSCCRLPNLDRSPPTPKDEFYGLVWVDVDLKKE